MKFMRKWELIIQGTGCDAKHATCGRLAKANPDQTNKSAAEIEEKTQIKKGSMIIRSGDK